MCVLFYTYKGMSSDDFCTDIHVQMYLYTSIHRQMHVFELHLHLYAYTNAYVHLDSHKDACHRMTFGLHRHKLVARP